MLSPSSLLLSAHRFLARHAFYPLALCTLIACGILAGHMHLTRSDDYDFLLWNLFLAWVPYGCSLTIALLKEAGRGGRGGVGEAGLLLGLSSVWLAFFPNAPYLATDVVHFSWSDAPGWWYSLVLLLTFGWTGCFLGAAS